MPYLSITRLHLKSRWLAPKFLIANEPVFQQLMQCEGYLGGKALMDFSGGAWTITLWKDIESMRQFYLSGAHKKMMPLLNDYADEGATRTIECSKYQLPGWKRARDILAAEPKISGGIRTPSENHRNKTIPALWFPLLSRPLKPATKKISHQMA